MPKTIDVQGVGIQMFPDDATDAEISAALNSRFTSSTPATDVAANDKNFFNSELYQQGVQGAQSQADLDALQAVQQRAALGQGRAAQPGEVPLQSAGAVIQAEPDISSTVQQAIEPYTLQPPEGTPSVPLRPPRFADTEYENLTDAYKQGGVLGAMMFPHKFTALMPEAPPRNTTADRVAQAIGEIPFDVADFLATPEGAGTVLAGGTGPLARVAINLGFANDAVKGFLQAGTLEDKVKSGLMAVATVAGLGHEVLPSRSANVRSAAVAQRQAGIRAAMREPPPEPPAAPEVVPPGDERFQQPTTEGGPSATQERQVPVSSEQQYQGVPQGANVPADVTQVREGGREPAGGGGRVGTGAQVGPPSIQEVADWHAGLVNEAQQLGEQARLIQQAGHPVPRVVADRIAEINKELAAGFPERPIAPEVQPGGGVVSGQEEKVSPEAAAPQAVRPAGEVLAQMRPALKLEPGKAGAPDVIGEQGVTHADITTAHPEIGAELSTEDTVANKQRGFSVNGEWLTRKQAAEALGVEGELTSQKLRALQAKSEAGPVRAAAPAVAPEAAPKEAPPTPSPEFSGVARAAPIATISATEPKVSPVDQAAAGDFGPTWAKVKAEAARDPAKPARVSQDLAKKPRAANKEEFANLVQRRVELENEYDRALKERNANPGDQALKDRFGFVDQELQDHKALMERARGAAGEALNAVKLLDQRELTLSRMREETQAIENDGRPLTPQQEAKIQARHDELTQIDKDVAEHQASKMFDSVLKEERKTARASKEARKPLLQNAYENALKRIEGRRGKLYAGYDPTAILDETIVGAYHIARIGTDFARWSGEMIRQFGEKIKDRLPEVFARSKEYHLEASRAMKQPSVLTKDEIKDVQNLRRTEAALGKYGKAVAADQPLPKGKPPRQPQDPFLQQKRAELAQAREQYKPIAQRQKAEETISEQEKALTALGQPLPRAPIDRKLATLLGRKEQLKALIQLEQGKALFAKKPWWQRYGSRALGIGQEIQTIKSAYDISGVARQGGILGLGHPIKAAKSFAAMARVMKFGKAGELAAYEEMAKITNRPANLLDNRDQRSGVAVLDPNAVETSKREEAFRGVLAQKIPGIKWSERTFHIYLNKLRTEVLDSLVGQLEKMTGRKATDAELKVLGNYINIASGRGSWGKYNTALDAASKIMWSPRLLTSRLEFLMGQPLVHNLLKDGNLPAVRALIAKEYAQSAGGLATLLSLGLLAGAKIETDRRSTEFGKMRFGKVRIDPFAGVQQPFVLASQLISGQRKTQRGKVYPIRGDVPFGQPDAGELLMRFGFSKATPALGSAINVARGRTITGQPTSAVNEALNAVLPLSPGDVMSAFQAQGVPQEIGGAIAAITGMGTNAYQPVSSREQKAYRSLMESRDRDLLHGYIPSAYRKTVKMIKGPY